MDLSHFKDLQIGNNIVNIVLSLMAIYISRQAFWVSSPLFSSLLSLSSQHEWTKLNPYRRCALMTTEVSGLKTMLPSALLMSWWGSGWVLFFLSSSHCTLPTLWHNLFFQLWEIMDNCSTWVLRSCLWNSMALILNNVWESTLVTDNIKYLQINSGHYCSLDI